MPDASGSRPSCKERFGHPVDRFRRKLAKAGEIPRAIL